jgi:hypothetical protein
MTTPHIHFSTAPRRASNGAPIANVIVLTPTPPGGCQIEADFDGLLRDGMATAQ